MNRVRPKVFAAMSGGVDSSVAAALLKKHGYEVIGVHMRCYNLDGCADQDLEDARRAAETLDIPFYVFDFEKEYKERVVNYMVDGYRRGVTPNPDVECNREIKFGLFLKKALELGADCVATGHYARLRSVVDVVNVQNVVNERLQQAERYNKRSDTTITTFKLFTARDLNKDQSYFLWTLTQGQLKHCLFPIGEYTKPEVRRMARKFGLPNADKKDSQGICFLGKVTIADFLKEYIPARKGVVLTPAGETVGTHRGAEFYTIGQRHGFQIVASNKKQVTRENPKPHYVAEKNVETNTIVVAEGSDNPALYREEIQLTNVNFLAPITNYQLPITVFARVRYRQPLAKAKLVISNSQSVNRKRSKLPITNYRLLFSNPIKFVAPGQSAVFYSKRGVMLGGGVIV